MKKFLVFLCAVVLVFGMVGSVGAVTIGGGSWSYDFDDNAFVDSVIDSQGGLYWSGGTQAGLLNSDVNDGGIALYDGNFMSFAFSDNYCTNGVGADLAVFEAGSPAEDFMVSLSFFTDNTGWTTPIQYSTLYTGGSASGYNLNVAAIDLSDYGFATGDSISAVWIGGVTHPTAGGTDLVAIGAINTSTSVPEPSTILLLGFGLLSIAGLRRKNQ